MKPALISRLYFATWLILGTIAAGYFYYLFQTDGNPQVAQSSQPPSAQPANPDKNGPVRLKTTKRAADPGIAKAIANMRLEMNRLKGALETMGKENAALKEHVKSLETAFGPTTASLPGEPDKPQSKVMKAKAEERAAPQPKIEVTMGPIPGDGFAETGIPPAPLPIAGPRAPTRTLFAVQLAKKIEPETIGARWMALKKQHAGILGRLQPRTVEVPSSGPREKIATLIAGPFTNAAAAARACARLIAAGTKCESTVFTGTPIGKVAAR
ncbi:MAG: hypothetical protein ACTSP0_07550 [Alphaproteobacteria bacterium]